MLDNNKMVPPPSSKGRYFASFIYDDKGERERWDD